MKKNIFKVFNIAVTLLLTAAVFAGCSSEGSSSNSTAVTSVKPVPENLIGKITLSSYTTSGNDSHLDDYILEFNSQYNNVEVEIIHDEIGEDEYFEELDERIESGTIGDVFLIDDERLAKYASEGKILDLTPYVENYMDYETYEIVDPSTELYEAAYLSSTYNGDLYMGATEYYHNFIFVNYSLIEECGLSVPGDTWTWDELISDAEAIKEQKGIENPIVMDYTDYSIWGAFARSYGDDIYTSIGNSDTLGINLTSPDVISGLEDLASIVDSGLVYQSESGDISAEDLSKYAFIVADHTDLVEWNEYLSSEECDFNWDYMHFPRWNDDVPVTDENGNVSYPYYQSIGAKTYGFAVYFRGYDETYNEEHYEMCAQLALYGLVDNAVEKYVGDGESVPANKAISVQRFWRDYPVEGKNTSVFCHYSDAADFSSVLTSFMPISSANALDIESAVQAYLNEGKSFADSLQEMQNEINAAWIE